MSKASAYTEKVTLRGRQTFFEGYFPVVTVNSQGLAKAVRNPAPRWDRVHKIDYIVGQTLRRLVVIEQSKGLIKCVARDLNYQDRKRQCDGCLRRHAASNERCSATLGIDSFASNKGVLYAFGSRKPAGKWILMDETFGGNSKTGVATYKLVR